VKKWRLMALDNPTKIERFLVWARTPKGIKAMLYCFCGLVILGLSLYIVAQVSDWWQGREIDKLKSNVNVALDNLKTAQNTIVEAKKEEAVALQAVNNAVQDYTMKTNATDGAKAETNRALQNMASAINANRNVSITANDLEKRLNEIP